MFSWCTLACLFPIEDNKNKVSKHVIHISTLCLEGLEFPMKVNDIPEFERLNRINIYVFELNGTFLTPIHFNKYYSQPQIDLLLYENHYCLITKFH